MTFAWHLLAAGGNPWIMTFGKPRADGSFPWEGPAALVAIGAAVAVIAWLASLWLRQHEQRNKNSPQRLLKELATAHQLTRRERKLLALLADHHHLLQPATLFVEPRLWEPDSLPAFAAGARAAEFGALKNRLFSRATASSSSKRAQSGDRTS